jgi:chromosome segregation ATPase
MICLLCLTTASAQNSAGGTSTSASAPDKNKVIARLLDEIDSGRTYIAQLEARERALTDEVEKAHTAEEKLADAHQAALLELGELRATIQYQKDALAERQKEVDELKTELDAQRKENKKLRRENLLLKIGYGVLILLGTKGL